MKNAKKDPKNDPKRVRKNAKPLSRRLNISHQRFSKSFSLPKISTKMKYRPYGKCYLPITYCFRINSTDNLLFSDYFPKVTDTDTDRKIVLELIKLPLPIPIPKSYRYRYRSEIVFNFLELIRLPLPVCQSPSGPISLLCWPIRSHCWNFPREFVHNPHYNYWNFSGILCIMHLKCYSRCRKGP